jgi:hypothetical protein
MMRIGLSIHLMFVMLAGPALCCCTTRHLMIDATSGKQGCQTSGSGSCCQHKRPIGHQTDAGPGSNNKQPPTQSPCPCKHHGSQFLTLLTAEAELMHQLQAKQFAQWLPLNLALLQDSLLPLLQTPSVKGNQAFALPFLTSHDLLHVHHLLRC